MSSSSPTYDGLRIVHFGAVSVFTHVTACQLGDGLTLPFCLPGFDHFVTLIAAGIATRLGRPLPGQDLYLLEQRTFHGTPGLAHTLTLRG